jgi:CubicO group peptidase (beta-lactamase class C family)
MKILVLATAMALIAVTPSQAGPMFPGTVWEWAPAEVETKAGTRLTELSKLLGGRGCVVKDGKMIHSWGDQSERSDWMSAAKPVLSTLLFFALQEGKVKSVDQPIAEFGWPLSAKDQGITFRHLGAMSSGYARPEGPGEAWAYNDYAIQLYQKTLFEKVFQQSAQAVTDHPDRLSALQFEDGLNWREDKPRLRASTRDFARIAWFWHNKGRWGDRQLLPEDYFTEFVKPQAPASLPNSATAETDDYLGIGTYGGGSAHFAHHGPGIYGFNWWFNRTGPSHPEKPLWPGVPEDIYAAIGAGGNFAAIFPAQNMLLISAKGDWGSHQTGETDTKTVQVLRMVVSAADGLQLIP